MLLILIFFFNDTATTEIYTLSLHDALPICDVKRAALQRGQSLGDELAAAVDQSRLLRAILQRASRRSEEHTSELQSQSNLVCRLLLEKKKHEKKITTLVHRRGREIYRALHA